MKKIYAIPGKSLSLGRLGENGRTQIVFPVTDWLEEYPDASIVLFNKRPKESTEYPVVISGPDNGEVFWTVENTELAIDGDGECMLQIMEDSVVAKSANWRTKILPALTGADDPPEPWESLMDDMAELVGQAQDAAEDAADSAEDAAGSAAAAETAGATAGAEAGATAGAAAGATAGASAGAAAVAELIDDTAGAGDTNKVWSANKSYNEINTRATKENPSFTGTFSVNRKSETTVGNNSTAVGYNSEASATSAIALGYGAKATASYSFAAGYNASATSSYAMAIGSSTTASSGGAFAEGLNTTASGSAAHAENMFTESSGYCSHSQGYYTIANHEAQHVMGMYNIADPSTANPNARGNYVEIVGNGNTDNTRSNARALDWNGNERLAGDVYVQCSSDSTGGYKLISAADVATTTETQAIITEYGVTV